MAQNTQQMSLDSEKRIADLENKIEMLTKQLADTRGKPSAGEGDAEWAESLAMAISNLTQQGSGFNKKIAPEVLRNRELARDKMIDVIVKARADGQKARYALKAKVFLNERKIDPFWVGPDHLHHRTEIDWTGIPSEAMIPLNAVAKEIYGLFRESIGTATKFLDKRETHVTANGLTVYGPPRAGRRMGGDPNERRPADRQGNAPDGFEDDLALPHRKPGGLINMLGTAHPPVREDISYAQRGER